MKTLVYGITLILSAPLSGVGAQPPAPPDDQGMAMVIQIPKDGEPQYRATGGRSLENCSVHPQQGATPRCRGFGQDGKVLDAYGIMIFRTTGSNCIAVTDQFTGASRQVCW